MVLLPVVTFAANNALPEVGTLSGTGNEKEPPPPPVVATAAAGAGKTYRVVPPLPSCKRISVLTVVLPLDVVH